MLANDDGRIQIARGKEETKVSVASGFHCFELCTVNTVDGQWMGSGWPVDGRRAH